MQAMWVWQLEFSDDQGVKHAFGTLMDAGGLGDCSVEPSDRLIRFTAPVAVGDALVAQIYQMGELRWCSRHRIVSVDESTAASHPA